MYRIQRVCSISMLILFVCVSVVLAETVSDEARRHMVRGEAAVEMAKSPEDYEQAIREFQAATRIAPDWADPYYNLGLVQEKAGKYKEAVASLTRYLTLAPNATDAAKVKDMIYRLEYKAEQEITREEALDILGSLSNTAIWNIRGERANVYGWIRGFRREGDRIAVSYVCDIHYQNNNCMAYAEITGTANKLELKLYFDNWYWPCSAGVRNCRGAMGVLGQYNFEIISRQRVVVNAVESYPKIEYMAAQVNKKRFEYIRR